MKDVNGVKVLAVTVDGVDMNGLRNLGDQLKEKLGEGVVVIASVTDGKVNLMATATDERAEEGRSCRKPHQGHCRPCGRRRRRTAEHGPGRRKESRRIDELL